MASTTASPAFEPPSSLSVHQGLLPNTNRRDWAYHIGSLSSKDRIIFSKSSLIDFLKVHGIEVGPNCTELSALPRFAVFGKFDDVKAPSSASAAPEVSSLSLNESSLEAPRPAPSIPASTTSQHSNDTSSQNQELASEQSRLTRGIVVDRTDASGQAWKPTRRVREAVGGGSAQIAGLFGGDDHDDDQALKDAEAEVKSRRSVSGNHSQPNQSSQPQPPAVKETPRQPPPQEATEKWRPTRRVREDVGGGSAQIGALFGGGDDDDEALREAEAAVRARRGGGISAPEEGRQPAKFIPSRRVREPGGTGGASSITFD